MPFHYRIPSPSTALKNKAFICVLFALDRPTYLYQAIPSRYETYASDASHIAYVQKSIHVWKQNKAPCSGLLLTQYSYL